MDWNTVRQPATQKAYALSATLLETCWRFRSTHTGCVISCGIYRDAAPGLEVRCGYSEEDLLRSQRTAEIGTARDFADDWKRAVPAKGGFQELLDEQ
jgi:hypothetical protein